jgi:hypothetical protein
LPFSSTAETFTKRLSQGNCYLLLGCRHMPCWLHGLP